MGLALWLKADAITGLADGDPVASWADSSGNSHTATQATSGSRPTSAPSNSMLPPVWRSRRSTSRSRVDLPQPLSPTKPRMLPGWTASTAPSTARTGPDWVR